MSDPLANFPGLPLLPQPANLDLRSAAEWSAAGRRIKRFQRSEYRTYDGHSTPLFARSQTAARPVSIFSSHGRDDIFEADDALFDDEADAMWGEQF